MSETVKPFLNPEDYMFSVLRGSLFKDSDVENEFPLLERTGRALPYLFGTNELYPYLEKLRESDLRTIDALSRPQLHRVAKRYAFLASAWFKNHSHKTLLRPEPNILPKNLARPFVYVSQKLGIPPILSYSHYCQCNWVMKNPGHFIELDNLTMEQTFVDPQKIPDEPGFVLVHAVIEYLGKSIPFCVKLIKEAMQKRCHPEVASALWVTADAIERMHLELKKMPQWCSPEAYYIEVRPQIQLFKNVIYEGAEEFGFNGPVTLRGETGAQTPLVALIIALLDPPQTQTMLTQHTKDMRNYMLPLQRAFIEHTEQTPSLREYVIKHWREYPRLRTLYNQCLYNMYLFLAEHFFGDVINYIEKKGEGKIGTGGTPFREFLQLHLWEVRKGRISHNKIDGLWNDLYFWHQKSLLLKNSSR